MSTTRSDKYYFPRGDLVIQVENTIFKLHRDILEMHSGFFEDMFSMPTNDDAEGTDERPLVLPSDLCSAFSFTVLCKFLYPRKVDSLPVVSANKLEEWEPVLRATVALQMSATQKAILARLEEDTANIASNAAKLLRISMDYEEASSSLMRTCLMSLMCRPKRVTSEEYGVLGGRGTYVVSHARELTREFISTNQARILQQLRDTPGAFQSPHAFCKLDLISNIAAKLNSSTQSQTTEDTRDIFQDDSGKTPCPTCGPSQDIVRKVLKRGLDTIADDFIKKTLSIRSDASQR